MTTVKHSFMSKGLKYSCAPVVVLCGFCCGLIHHPISCSYTVLCAIFYVLTVIQLKKVCCLFVYLLNLFYCSFSYFLFNNENSSKRKHYALCVSNKCTNWNRVCEWSQVPTISSPHSNFSVIRLPQFHSGFPIPCTTLTGKISFTPSDTGAKGKTDNVLKK